MKRQKRAKKTGGGSVLKNISEAVAKRFINIAVVLIFLVVVFLLGKAYLYRSDYFKLRRVEIKETLLDTRSLVAIKSRILSSYKAKSVFELNLKAIAQSLQASYPDAKDISVTLALPDKLVIGLKLRKPVALVKSDKLYPVDEEGVILPIADTASLKWIPVVEGVQMRPAERKAKIITSANFKAAIALLRAVKDIKPVANYGIETVDVKDMGNISFCLRNGVEVRVGSENLKERLMILAKTVGDPRLVMERIKYIDLRFGDPVIGPR